MHPAWRLLLVLALIALSFYLLEKARNSAPMVSEEPQSVERHRMPPHATIGKKPTHRAYSAAVMPLVPHKPLLQKRAGGGTIAIIVDDMGSNTQEARTLLAIDAPITFSIIPGLAKDRGVAEAAHAGGHEVIVHMPMEPDGYPGRKLEKNGLLLSQSDAEIEKRLMGYFQSVPYAVGANNHMGSRFTEDGPKMRTVLGVLKERGLFFLDSRTSPRSVGYKLAREMGMRAGVRNVFLDNKQDEAYIRGQLNELAATAAKRGSAVGICHPHKTTLKVLASEIPAMKAAGVRFVYISKLIN